MTTKPPAKKLDQYIVRFPEGMRDALKRRAAENNRSLNAEIIARLEASFDTIETALTPAQSEAALEVVRRYFAEQNADVMRRLEDLERKYEVEFMLPEEREGSRNL